MSDRIDGSSVTLDDFFAERELTFVKADIEGAEPAMLRGGERVFAAKVRALLVCCYHYQADERTIKEILDRYEYSYRDNPGYAIAFLSRDDRKEPYLRRCVLYAMSRKVKTDDQRQDKYSTSDR